MHTAQFDACGPHPVRLAAQFRFALLTLAALEAPFHLELPMPPQQWDPPQPSTAPLPAAAAATPAAADAAPDAPAAAAAAEAAVTVQPAGPPAAKYGEDVVFVANDWHASLLPVYLAAKYRPYGVYRNARSILAIHNLRHQVGCAAARRAGIGHKA